VILLLEVCTEDMMRTLYIKKVGTESPVINTDVAVEQVYAFVNKPILKDKDGFVVICDGNSCIYLVAGIVTADLESFFNENIPKYYF
jgi:hypothetical protein